jgi:hypothetical protein
VWLFWKREKWYFPLPSNVFHRWCIEDSFVNADSDTIDIHSVAYLENQMLSSLALESQSEYIQWIESYVAKVCICWWSSYIFSRF